METEEYPPQQTVPAATGDWLGLVARAQHGDLHAFDALVRRFQDAVVAYGAALLGDFHLAQDAAQDAFLEAFRTLPALRTPAAFPSRLRLLVHKHCDRWRRRRRITTVALEAARGLAHPGCDPHEEVARRETQAAVRAAIHALPEAERSAVLLYYGAAGSAKEVAAFLGVPVSTVKNRLHTARRRLHERMLPLMEETLKEQRPSNDDRFRGRVFVRLQDEFLAQYRHDPQTADRSLLARSRHEFERYLAQNDLLDPDAAHFGSYLYTILSDYAPLADLMARYLSQPLPLVEEAWARWEQVRALAAVRRCEEVVQKQRAFVSWARERLPGDPPIRLSDPGSASFRPLKEGEETDEGAPADRARLPVDALLPWVVNTSEVTLCFKEMGLQTEWAQTVRSLVGAAPKTRASRLYRFWALRCLVVMFYGTDTLDEALRATQDIRALGDEDPADWEAPRWPIEAAYMQMVAYTEAGEDEAARTRGEEATRLLEEWAGRIDQSDPAQQSSFKILCDNVASPLADRGHCDLALRLFPRVLEGGGGSGWAHVRYAACLWATTGEREPVLELLRRGAPRELGEGLLSFFRSLPAFASVKDDPEFVAAITAP